VSIFVRPAEPQEAADIQSILQASFGEYQSMLKLAEPPAALTETMESIEAAIKSQTVLIAIYNRLKAVGTIRVRKAADDVAYITRFAVVPNWQQSGAGSALMDAAVQWCRENGCRAVALHTAVKMSTLVRFYYGWGYYVHSVEITPSGYRRGLFVKELEDCADIEFEKIDFSLFGKASLTTVKSS
jgi:GNAT superfamily N-acetyltransferase